MPALISIFYEVYGRKRDALSQAARAAGCMDCRRRILVYGLIITSFDDYRQIKLPFRRFSMAELRCGHQFCHAIHHLPVPVK